MLRPRKSSSSNDKVKSNLDDIFSDPIIAISISDSSLNLSVDRLPNMITLSVFYFRKMSLNSWLLTNAKTSSLDLSSTIFLLKLKIFSSTLILQLFSDYIYIIYNYLWLLNINIPKIRIPYFTINLIMTIKIDVI